VHEGDVFETKRDPKPFDAQRDPDRLYAKIGQLNMELDWLKKNLGSTEKTEHQLRAVEHFF